MSLPFYPNILLIAGSGRNIGKTTFAESIIKRYANQFDLIGLKVTSIYAGENQLHGGDHNKMIGGFKIMEEVDAGGRKDTSRMLRAGAKRTFYIQTDENAVSDSMQAFFKIVPPDAIIVCESGSLRFVLRPGLFILIEDNWNSLQKQRFMQLVPLADRVININNRNTIVLPEMIMITPNGWTMQGERG